MSVQGTPHSYQCTHSHSHIPAHCCVHTHSLTNLPHPHVLTLIAPLSQTFKFTQSCSHMSCTQHILINTSRSYTCTHICTHTHILTLTPSSLSRFHTQLCSHVLSLTHSQTPSLLHYLASPYSCMLTRVHIHTQTPHLSRRLQDQCL